MRKDIFVWIPVFTGMTIVIVLIGLYIQGVINLPDTNKKKVSGKLENKMQITASFYPIAFLAEQIGGERVEVSTLTPPGVEPHDFEPTTKDIATLQKSTLLLMNGSGVEVYEEKITQMLEGSKVKVVAIGTPFADGEIVKEGSRRTDPHVWIDPIIYGKMAEKVVAELSAVDSAHQAEYTGRAEKLVKKLNTINSEYQAVLTHCSLKKIVTAHTAFGYIASRYGFEQIGISGLSPEEEPSPKELAEISDMIQQEGVHAILVEEIAPRIWGETIAKETGAKILVLSPIEGGGEDYFSVQRSNIQTLCTALDCN